MNTSNFNKQTVEITTKNLLTKIYESETNLLKEKEKLENQLEKLENEYQELEKSRKNLMGAYGSIEEKGADDYQSKENFQAVTGDIKSRLGNNILENVSEYADEVEKKVKDMMNKASEKGRKAYETVSSKF